MSSNESTNLLPRARFDFLAANGKFSQSALKMQTIFTDRTSIIIHSGRLRSAAFICRCNVEVSFRDNKISEWNNNNKKKMITIVTL